jgi:hypothetical protein
LVSQSEGKQIEHGTKKDINLRVSNGRLEKITNDMGRHAASIGQMRNAYKILISNS